MTHLVELLQLRLGHVRHVLLPERAHEEVALERPALAGLVQEARAQALDALTLARERVREGQVRVGQVDIWLARRGARRVLLGRNVQGSEGQRVRVVRHRRPLLERARRGGEQPARGRAGQRAELSRGTKHCVGRLLGGSEQRALRQATMLTQVDDGGEGSRSSCGTTGADMYIRTIHDDAGERISTCRYTLDQGGRTSPAKEPKPKRKYNRKTKLQA
jgi:hypothetical protein